MTQIARQFVDPFAAWRSLCLYFITVPMRYISRRNRSLSSVQIALSARPLSILSRLDFTPNAANEKADLSRLQHRRISNYSSLLFSSHFREKSILAIEPRSHRDSAIWNLSCSVAFSDFVAQNI